MEQLVMVGSITLDMSESLTNWCGITRTLGEWLKVNRIKRVYARHGDWLVTDYGLECLTWFYPIEKARLWEQNGGHTWLDHMATKRWVDLGDFNAAWEAAKAHHRRWQRVN